MQDAEPRPLQLISEQIADKELRKRVVNLAMQLTPHDLVQAELVSVAMECLAQKNQRVLANDDAYRKIFCRMLERVRGSLLSAAD